MNTLLEIFFLPPNAVARVGSSDTPVEAYEWAEDISAHGGTQTVVRPAITLDVAADGQIHPYLPTSIHFKDADGRIRPVAPFFELWAKIQTAEDGSVREVPVTLELLDELQITPKHIEYQIRASNQKAERRAQSAACSFTGAAKFNGDNYEPQKLNAYSRHTGGEQPLVFRDKPIDVGSIQAIRPVQGFWPSESDPQVDLSVLRLRFTPPRGLVYGPPTAVSGPASPLPQGLLSPPSSEYGNIHMIVTPENRILNDQTPWSTSYAWGTGQYEDPQPQDGYDGADVGSYMSWGSIDDVTDAIIEANLAWRGQRFTAAARVFTGPPDFAPDRRPFFSIADDLADRELPVPEISKTTLDETETEILDLFERAYESASLFNLDAARFRALVENEGDGPLNPEPKDVPAVDGRSMTSADAPYVDKIPVVTAPQPPSKNTKAVKNDELPFTNAVRFVHSQMIDRTLLLDFLRRRKDHVKKLIRPPIGSFSQLERNPGPQPNPDFRDPRVPRDRYHDMRMPPYMRDANLLPLSLTRRQYQTLMKMLDVMDAPNGHKEE